MIGLSIRSIFPSGFEKLLRFTFLSFPFLHSCLCVSLLSLVLLFNCVTLIVFSHVNRLQSRLSRLILVSVVCVLRRVLLSHLVWLVVCSCVSHLLPLPSLPFVWIVSVSPCALLRHSHIATCCRSCIISCFLDSGVTVLFSHLGVIHVSCVWIPNLLQQSHSLKYDKKRGFPCAQEMCTWENI